MESNGMSDVTLNRPEDHHQIATRTLAQDEHLAQSDWEGTRDHDVSQTIAALLMHIDGVPPLTCWTSAVGPGETFAPSRCWVNTRHRAVGLEGHRVLRRMRAAIAAVRCWSKSCINSTCPRSATTGCSPMPCCFNCPVRFCPRTSSTARVCSLVCELFTALARMDKPFEIRYLQFTQLLFIRPQ